MVYGETGRYPLYIDSTISSLRYWFKLSKMPVTRFPKQALIMLKNRLDTNTTHTNRKRERESQDRDSETETERDTGRDRETETDTERASEKDRERQRHTDIAREGVD